MNQLRAAHNIITTLMISGCQKYAYKEKYNLIKLFLDGNPRCLNSLLPTLNFPISQKNDLFPHMKEWIESYFSDQFKVKHLKFKSSQGSIEASNSLITINDLDGSELIAVREDGDFYLVTYNNNDYRVSFLSEKFEFVHFRPLTNETNYPLFSIEELPNSWYRGKIKGIKFKIDISKSKFYGLLYSTDSINNTNKKLLLESFQHILPHKSTGSYDDISQIMNFGSISRDLIKLIFTGRNNNV